MSTKKELSTKHLLFCKHYLTNIANKVEAPGLDAARTAGFKDSTGLAVSVSRLLLRDDVKEYIAAHQQKITAKTEITSEKKMDILWDIAQMGIDKDRISAINILNKMQGHESAAPINPGNHISVVLMLPPNNREVQIINKES